MKLSALQLSDFAANLSPASLSCLNCAISGSVRFDEAPLCLNNWRSAMSDTKSARTTLGMLGRAMDEIAREFRATNPYDPNRGPLLQELSALTQLRIWIASEANRALVQPMDELARALAALTVSNRKRIQIIAEIISSSHSLNEH
jgi:hypothetical protein